MADQDKDETKPISSGLLPGPGEHLADPALSVAATASATDIGTDSSRGRTETSYGSTTSGGAFSTSEFAEQTHDHTFATTLRDVQGVVRADPGAFLVGTIVAGFLLTRLLKNSSMREAERQEVSFTPMTDRITQASQRARARIQQSAGGAQMRMNEMGKRSQAQYYRAKDQVGRLLDEQPIVIGALGIALGAAVGVAVRTTQRENALMGGMRDNLLTKAKETAREKTAALKQSAQQFTEYAKQEAARVKEDISNGGMTNNPSAGTSTPGVASGA